MIRIVFLIALGGMPLCLLIMMMLGLILLFSSKSRKELEPLKYAIAGVGTICGICMLVALMIFAGNL